MDTLAENKNKVVDISSARTPDWQQIKAIYEEGGGDPEVARALNITMKKFYELVEDVEAFAEFVELGRTMSMAWWYEKGRTGLFADKFNSALYNFNMKNRFGWADKTDISSSDKGVPASDDQLKSQFIQAVKRLAQKNPELLAAANINKPVKEAEDDAQ